MIHACTEVFESWIWDKKCSCVAGEVMLFFSLQPEDSVCSYSLYRLCWWQGSGLHSSTKIAQNDVFHSHILLLLHGLSVGEAASMCCPNTHTPIAGCWHPSVSCFRMLPLPLKAYQEGPAAPHRFWNAAFSQALSQAPCCTTARKGWSGAGSCATCWQTSCCMHWAVPLCSTRAACNSA